MSETTNGQTEVGGFGISQDLAASNRIPFKPGIQKGVLTEVKAYNKTSKKGEKYDVLEFIFSDLENTASYEKVEFAVDRTKDVDKKGIRGGKEKAMNIRIKHIYEAYAPFPTEGIGMSAKSWLEYFEMIAKAFNTNGKEGTPIFKSEGRFIPVWLKFTYFNNQLGFPYSPNFIDVMKEGKPTVLVIDLNFDEITQTAAPKKNSGTPHGNVVGGASSNADDFADFQ